MVHHFHPHECDEPRRGFLEELVLVGVDVEVAELVGHICLENARLEGYSIDNCLVSLVLRVWISYCHMRWVAYGR